MADHDGTKTCGDGEPDIDVNEENSLESTSKQPQVNTSEQPQVNTSEQPQVDEAATKTENDSAAACGGDHEIKSTETQADGGGVRKKSYSNTKGGKGKRRHHNNPAASNVETCSSHSHCNSTEIQGTYKWETMKMMMHPRVFSTAVTYKDDIYVIGGSDEKGQPVDSCEHYNVAKRKWTSLATMPTRRAAPACAVVGDKIIAVGGVGMDQGPVDAVEVFNISEKKWIKKESLLRPLLGLSCVVRDNLMYVIGGMDDESNPQATLMSYDVEKNIWQKYKDFDEPRYATFSFIVNDKLYVIGGRQGKIANLSLECYSFEENKWETLPKIPTKRVFSMYTAADKYIFSIGGLKQPDPKEGFSNCMEVFDTETKTWTNAAPMKHCRGDFAVGVVGDHVIAAGGLGNIGKPLKEVEAFDWKTQTWTELKTEMPSAHCSCAYTFLNGRLFVIGGLTIGGASKKVEALGFTALK